jgi:hypothetical protein
MTVRDSSNAISIQPPAFGANTGRIVSGGMTVASRAQDQFVGLDRFNQADADIDRAVASVDEILANPNPSPSSNASAPRGAKLLNPLRDYATFNYRLELGSLSVAEINTPESSYRANGLRNMIARSGGGNLGNRATVYAEDTLGKHAEYYIEDLMMETVLSPNSNTGVATGTNITFRVIEPYSMGGFIEALQVSAEQSGYQNYIEAPFCLKIDFVGQRDNTGPTETPVSPKYIPIKMLAAKFSIDGEGAKYDCEAIPFNEQALENTLTETKTDVSLQGKDVSELLHINEQSLTAVMNARNQTRETTGQRTKTDRMIIMFPTDPRGATAAIEGSRRDNSPLTVNPQALVSGEVDGAGNSSVYSILDSYARSNINEIGKSKIVLDPNEDRNHAQGDTSQSVSEDGTVVRGSSGLQIQDDIAVAQYPNGTDILSIIHEALKYSEYGAKFATEEAQNGTKQWYRIEVQTFLENSPAAELETGAMPKVFVYSVVPYQVDETSTGAPTKSPSGIETLRANALKEYNYLYTGTNEDIIKFDINFEFAFYQNTSDTSAQLGAGQQVGTETVNPQSPQGVTTGPQPNTQRITSSTSATLESIRPERATGHNDPGAGGFRRSLSRGRKAAIAEIFHDNIINSSADLIQANMGIRGDPYYLPTSGMGNYNAAPSSRPALNQDGTMNYQGQEVHCIVNFRMPFDYNDTSGRMDFSDKQAMFSGLYKIIGVTNNFSGGEFTQELDMVRIPGQQSPASSQKNQIVENPTATDANTRLTGTPGGTGSGINVVGNPNDSGRQETLPVPKGGSSSADRAASGSGSAAPSTTAPQGPPAQGGGNLGTITTSIRGLETQVAASLVPNFQGLIDELEQDLGYTINSIGGYNYRTISGSNTLSWHAGGVAIDINPGPNPYITRRNAQVVTDMPNQPNGNLMTALAEKYGLGWGGDWTSSKDAMHFSAARNEGGTLNVNRGEIPT